MKKLLLLISAFTTTISQAQTSATSSPGSATNTMCAFAYSSTVGYTPVGNVTASDNVYATAVHCDCCDQNTQCLTVSDFGFAIPAGSMIEGIVLEVEKKRTGGGSGIVEDNGLQIIKGGVLTGPNKSQYGVNWPATDTYVSYGSSTDLWGTTWTAADINASDFGVSLASISYVCGATITTTVDHVRMTIYYSTATGIAEKAEGNGIITPFPNPAISGTTLSFSIINQIEKLTITNSLGQEIFNGSAKTNEINLPEMSKGIYFYRIENADNTYSGKLLIN